MQNLIESTQYIETINKLDNLINSLLYSQDDGFINQSSKEAILNANKVVEKFNFEADKIAHENSFSNIDEILKEKKDELINLINKHCSKQIYIWVDEVFNNMVDNCILKACVNYQNKKFPDEIYNRILSALDWVSSIKKYSGEEKNKILKSLNQRFNKALNSKDSDFLEKPNPLRSDYGLFFKLRNLVTDDIQKFLEIDFSEYKLKLTQQDINYFLKLQGRMQQNKTSVTDEINLVNCAIELLDIKNDSDKYCFISQIQDDLNTIKDETEDIKIEKIKRRMELFKNKDDYYKKLLVF